MFTRHANLYFTYLWKRVLTPFSPFSAAPFSALLKIIGLILAMGVGMDVNAGFLGFGGTSWEEEVLLHDGSKIIVKRSVERGGRHEIGQKPPYKEQSLSFSMPGTNKTILWEDHYSKDIGSSNFLPMAVDIYMGTTYLIAYPMGCLSYNKWNRPNPPYLIFKYENKKWLRIPLQELPADIKTPNLIFSMPDVEVERAGKNFITAEMIQKIYEGYSQPEFNTILREPFPKAARGCDELVHYKGAWVGPGDSIGKRMIDKRSK